MSDKWRARFPKGTELKENESEVIFSIKKADGTRIEQVGIMKTNDAEALNYLVIESWEGRKV